MYVNSCDQWEAIKELHRFRGLDLPKPEDTERQKESLEEFIARNCLKDTAPAMNYLTAVRKIPEKIVAAAIKRSEERRVGKACVSTGRSRWSQYDSKKKKTTERNEK